MIVEGIQIWGDSLFRGVQYDGTRKRHVLTSRPPVDMAASAIGLPVVNHARMGNTVLTGYQNMLESDAAKLKNHVVLLEFGGNDCDFDWRKIAQEPSAQHVCHVPPDQYRDTLLKMIGIIKNAGGYPVMTTLPPLNANSFFRGITSVGLNGENILAFLGDVQQIYRWQEYYSLINMQIALEQSIPCLPVREYFLANRPYREWVCEDGIHPNEFGYQLIYEVFISQWKKYETILFSI